MKKIVPQDAILIPDEAERVFEGDIFDVYQWQQKLYDGSFKVFEMLRRPDTVVAIAIDGDRIVIVQDEQPNRGPLLSLPGGRVDPEDASMLDAAKREVHEETGLSFANWKLVQVSQRAGKIEWFFYVYVANTVTARDKPHTDAGEKISVELWDFDKVKNLVFSKEGRLDDAAEAFKSANSCRDLIDFPEFQGREIDR